MLCIEPQMGLSHYVYWTFWFGILTTVLGSFCYEIVQSKFLPAHSLLVLIFLKLSSCTPWPIINHVRIIRKINLKCTGKTSKKRLDCDQHGDACLSLWRDWQPKALLWPLGQGDADPGIWGGFIDDRFWGQMSHCTKDEQQISPAEKDLQKTRAWWWEQGSTRAQESSM